MNKTRKLTIRSLASAVAVAAVSLMCLVSANVSATTVSTFVGSGADAELAGWTGPDATPASAADSANGTNTLANVRTTTNRNEVLVMRFDLTGYTLTDYSDYTIELINQRTNGSGATLRFYGVTDNAVAEDNHAIIRGYTDDTWQESPLEFSTMPGMHWTNSSTAQQVPNGSAVLLGSVTPSALNEGTVVSFGSAGLVSFIRGHPDQLITIIVQRSDSGSGQSRFMTKEASATAFSISSGAVGDFAPRLSFGNPFTLVTWTGPGNDWNQSTNWFAPIVPTNGLAAVIPAGFTVNYTTPMVASSFSGLTNSSTLNINTNNYTIDAGGGVPLVIQPSGVLMINTNGVVIITNSGSAVMSTPTSGTSPAISVQGGTFIVTNSSAFNMGESTNSDNSIGAAFTNNGGNVIFGSQLAVRSRDSRLFMSNGTFNALGGINLNTAGNDLRQFFRFTAGAANLYDVNVNRASTAGGLSVEGGVVNSTSMRIGTGVASGNSRMTGGTWTNAGAFYIGDRNNPATGSRRTFFTMSGGSLTTLGTDGIVINNQGQTTLALPTDDGGTLTVNGGTITTEGIYLNGPAVTANAYARFQLTAGTIYLGSVGLVANTVGSDMTAEFTISGGTLAAKADWTSSASLPLTGPLTVLAADASGTPHNISLSGVISGGSSTLTKTGTGTLTLSGANTFGGNTTVSAGTLALGPGGALASAEILLGSNTVFDVSANSYTLPSAKTLSGFGVVTGDVAVASTAIIAPGSNSAPTTLTFRNSLTQTGGAVTRIDLSTNPSGPNNDLIVVGADLNVSGLNTIEITGGGPPGSVHPLFKYSGTFNGALSSFTNTGPSGTLTNITSTTPKSISFVVSTALRANTNIVWVGNAVTNDWDLQNATNWLVGAGLDKFINGDFVIFNATGAGRSNVNIPVVVQPATVTVNAATDYTFSGAGSISGGLTTLTKTNSGKLTIQNDNAFAGGVNFNGGTISVASFADAANPSPLGASGTLAFNGGALEYTGLSTNWTRGLSFAGTGALSIANATETLTLAGPLTGGGVLNKTGSGTLSLNSAASTYSGGTVVSNGTLAIGALAGAGTGAITLNTGAILSIGGAHKPANPVVIAGPSIISGGNGGGSNGVAAISGSADVVISVTTGVLDLTGTLTNYSGTMTMSNAGGATVRFNGAAGSSLATFDLGQGAMDLFGRTSLSNLSIGALKGGASTTLSGRGTADNSGPSTYHIGANGLSTVFDGIIRNGIGALSYPSIVKTGTGKLTLTGANTYYGTTTISNGILQVDGSLSTNTVTVEGGTLNGIGSIGGTVFVNAAGTIAPGDSVGTMTISGDLNLGGKFIAEVNTTNAPTADLAQVSGTVNYGGTLVVSNLGPAILVTDTFQLFSASAYNGAFAAVIPAQAAPGLYWDTNTLTTDGILRVTTTAPVNTSRTNITFTAGGGNLTIGWPADHTGWTLQTQTNSRSVGLNTNWFDVAGSSTTNQVTVPITPATPTVFYRLQYFIP